MQGLVRVRRDTVHASYQHKQFALVPHQAPVSAINPAAAMPAQAAISSLPPVSPKACGRRSALHAMEGGVEDRHHDHRQNRADGQSADQRHRQADPEDVGQQG